MSRIVVVITEALTLERHHESTKFMWLVRVVGVHLIISAQDIQ